MKSTYLRMQITSLWRHCTSREMSPMKPYKVANAAPDYITGCSSVIKCKMYCKVDFLCRLVPDENYKMRLHRLS